MDIPTKLAKLNAHPRDQFIEFDEGPHIYTVKGDSSFMSVTTWNHRHFQPFDADKIIAKMMRGRNWRYSKYFGQTPDEIKALWEKNRVEASTLGTQMHYQIELFYNDIQTPPPYSTEFTYFLQFHKDTQSTLEPFRTEWMVYDEELKLAGSIDMLFRDRTTGDLHIYDWKRSKEIKDSNKYQQATTECIRHLPDSNYWHYSLQLNTYKYILEKNYGVSVKSMCLVCLHPNHAHYKKYVVSDMSEEIKNLMQLRYNMIHHSMENSLVSLYSKTCECLKRVESVAAHYQ